MNRPEPETAALPHQAGQPRRIRQDGTDQPEQTAGRTRTDHPDADADAVDTGSSAVDTGHGATGPDKPGRATTARRRGTRPSHRTDTPGQREPAAASEDPDGRADPTPEPGNHAAADARAAALRSFDLAGRVALVTGASSGLGAAVGRALAGLGAQVALVARRRDRLDALAAEIGGLALSADLSDPDAIAGLVPEVAEKLGPPEILVNAAGNRFGTERAESEPLDDIRNTLDLNLVAPLLLAQQVFPYMRDVGRGSIVNISSISGRVGVPGIPQASYAASKAGLSGLTSELAVQWARHSIRVNTVAPGFFRSEITGSLYDSARGAEYLRRNTALPTEGTAEDMVGAVVWLAGDAGRYVTGQTIVVDGGWTAR